MKAFGILVLVLILSLLSTARADLAYTVCPLESAGETELDCPWGGIARSLEPILKANPDPKVAAAKVEKLLEMTAPEFMIRLTGEGKRAGDAKKLWGRSINYDENAKGIIVPEPVLDVVLARGGVAPRDGRVVHAGFEHTYGYLLSNLRTPYGYKRLRWVRPDIENGFGLERGVLSPTPASGALLMNVTVFAGKIAFRGENAGDRAAMKILRRTLNASRGLHRFDYETLHGRRLTETVVLGPKRTVEIRTDFVPFTQGSGESTGGNAELLVYSIRDSAEPNAYLISAFPIAKGFSDAALDPKNLGEKKSIVTRYNAFVDGITNVNRPTYGKREASSF